jgi:glycosyltransferase involved in cell wall biosynthesis
MTRDGCGRVLHVIPSVGPLRGGPSIVIKTITRSLAGRGLDVHVVTTDCNGPERLRTALETPVTEEGVTYRFFARQSRLYTFSHPLARWLARHTPEYDLVHIHALFSHASTAAALAARRSGVPYIVRPLGTLNRWGMEHRRPWLKRVSFLLLERRILEHAAAVHYTSEQERIEAEQAGCNGRPFVIPNPVEVRSGAGGGAFAARFPAVAGRKVVLFLSRIDEKKGLDLLLAAFASVRRKCADALLVIAGDGPRELMARLRLRADNLGIAGDVIWAGFLEGRDKLSALETASVFVLPSYSENFGVAVVEAMAVRLPVLVSDQVGICREIAQAAAGIVVPCDPADIGNAMTHVLENPDLAERLGRNAEMLVRSRFSIETVTDQLISMYDRVLPAPVPASAGAQPSR